MEKSLHNTDVNTAKSNVPDIVTFGGDQFKLLSKASSEAEGWMKSTKAMQVDDGGCVVQVTTQQRNPDGTYSLAEAVCYVPDCMIHEEVDRDVEDPDAVIIGRELYCTKGMVPVGIP